MIQCDKCKSNLIKTKIIDNGSNIRTKIYTCKMCDYQKQIKYDIRKKRKV